MKISFWLEHRNNSFAPRGKEWALNCRLDLKSSWTLVCWDNEPKTADVERVKCAVMRGMEMYHRAIEIPPFRLEEGTD